MKELRETGEVVRIYNREVDHFKAIEPLDCFVHLSTGIYMGQLIAKQQPSEDGYPNGCAYVYVLTSKKLMLPDGNPVIRQKDEESSSVPSIPSDLECLRELSDELLQFIRSHPNVVFPDLGRVSSGSRNVDVDRFAGIVTSDGDIKALRHKGNIEFDVQGGKLLSFSIELPGSNMPYYSRIVLK